MADQQVLEGRAAELLQERDDCVSAAAESRSALVQSSATIDRLRVAVCQPVILLTRINELFSGYFHPVNIIFDSIFRGDLNDFRGETKH